MSVTARSVLSSALVGENPYIAAERVIEKLDAAGWEIVRKPRIPEPGLWGVVEAGVKQHDARCHWINLGGHWRPDDTDEYDRMWADLVDPILVREGVA